MSHTAESGITLRDIFRVLFRHKGKGLLFFLFIMGAVAAYTFLLPKTYRSEGRMLVRLGRENTTLDPTATVGQGPITAVPQTRETEMLSVLETLQGRTLYETVVDRIGPVAINDGVLQTMPVSTTTSSDATSEASGSFKFNISGWLQDAGVFDKVSDRERAIQKISKSIELNAPRKSSVIAVAFESRSPEAAQAVVASMMEAYQEQHIRANRSVGSRQFLFEQTEQVHDQLKTTANKLRDLKTSSGLSSLSDQRQILVERIGKLEDESLTTASALAAAEAQLKEMRKSLVEIPAELTTAKTTGFPNVAADTMRGQFFTLQIKEQELLAKYRDTHPEVVAIRGQIQDAKKILDEQEPDRVQETKGPNHLFETAKAALMAQEPIAASLRAKADTVKTQIADSKRSLKSLNDNEVLLADLQRELDQSESKYRRYSESLAQAKLDESLETQRMSNITVTDPASLNPIAIKPNKPVYLALGGMVGIFGALALALLCEYFDHSLNSPEEIEKQLDLPTLVTIPRMRQRKVALIRRRSRT